MASRVYIPIEDGEDLTALKVNTNFVSAQVQLNTVNRDNLTEGALGPDQLPSLVGAGVYTTVQGGLGPISNTHTDDLINRFSGLAATHSYTNVLTNPGGATLGYTNFRAVNSAGGGSATPTDLKVEWGDENELKTSSLPYIGGLLVLANVHFRRIDRVLDIPAGTESGGDGEKASVYYFGGFAIQLKSSNGTWYVLDRTWRFVSERTLPPVNLKEHKGWTGNEPSYFYQFKLRNEAYEKGGDESLTQESWIDVPIRTLITNADLVDIMPGGAQKITGVRVVTGVYTMSYFKTVGGGGNDITDVVNPTMHLRECSLAVVPFYSGTSITDYGS